MMTVPLAEVRANLSRLVDDAVTTHARVAVTRNGRRAAVLLSADDYDSLMETLDILSDDVGLRDLREAEAALDRGEAATLDDAAADLAERRRATA